MKFSGIFLTFLFVFTAQAQTLKRDFVLKVNGLIEITNFYGRVNVSAEEAQEGKVSITAESNISLSESEMKTSAENGKVTVQINPKAGRPRVDLDIKIPLRSRVRVETRAGAVRIAGDVESAEAITETGTISTDIPLDNLKYDFLWRLSRPRYLSDVPLADVKERTGGRFTIDGKLAEVKKDKTEANPDSNAENTSADESKTDEDKAKDDKKKGKKIKDKGQISLNLITDRGIILLNVNPSEVPSDLRERPLTEAAKAIVQSGDSLLMEAIRRASPKYFGDYAKTLPPRKIEPTLNDKPKDGNYSTAKVKRALVRVADINNRAIEDLKKDDFVVTESGKEREVLSVEPTVAPFNLVLLLDVSGSVENYVNFIRKAARNFINTTNPQDKIAILIFNEDVKQLTTFTTDRNKLSESLDTFDAGGSTAYYDAVAYSLVATLKPFRGERTAVVILSDGDDNRSFLPFDALLGSIQESGALIYPLYVPSELVAASATNNSNQAIDPLRTRYMGLTSKAQEEGAKLAKISGGVYYPIRQLADLQKAYDDIVLQLRTAYTITFRSNSSETTGTPHLKVRTKREDTFVNIGTIYDAPDVSDFKSGVGSQESRVESFKLKSRLRQKLSFQNSNVRLQIPNFEINSTNSQLQTQQPQEITGDVAEVKYKSLLTENLPVVSAEGFDVNKSPPFFVLNNGKSQIAFSRWVSPKRTRSYPYERIYNTLTSPKRATIIPILKDEGANGERDFLQFDTVSLMNLLNVYLVLGYYNDAQRDSANTLTDQKFDNQYILRKINELNDFKGSASEWNFKQLQEISTIAEKAKTAYADISKTTGVTLHNENGVDAFVKKISKSLEDFRNFSRQKSQKAQAREFQTIQPKESLSSDTKGRVTISDASGGKYFFTCDETKVDNQTVYLIEDKHTVRAKIPSQSDIKDGLLKMMVYSNMKNVRVGSENVGIKAVLRLTSNKLDGKISSDADAKDIERFLQTNNFTKKQREFIFKLFEEARINKFEIRFEHAEIEK